MMANLWDYILVLDLDRELVPHAGAGLQMVVTCVWQWRKPPTVPEKTEGLDTGGEMWHP